MIFVAPLALLYLGWLSLQGTSSFGAVAWTTEVTIMGTGVISMVPLVLFAFATRRLTYTTLGLLQYVAPTCQFLMGWLVFGEPFAGIRIVGFLLIWAGIACYTVSTIRRQMASTA